MSTTLKSNGHKCCFSWLQQASLSVLRNASEKRGTDRDITMLTVAAFAGLKFAYPCFTELRAGKRDAEMT